MSVVVLLLSSVHVSVIILLIYSTFLLNFQGYLFSYPELAFFHSYYFSWIFVYATLCLLTNHDKAITFGASGLVTVND